MDTLVLKRFEEDQIENLLSIILSKHENLEDVNFLSELGLYAHQLPERVRRFLHQFKINEPQHGICVVSGLRICQDSLGETPDHWLEKGGTKTARRECLVLMLFGTVLGDVFGWKTQQNGRIIHDLLPIRSDEDKQIGTGSMQTISWHTEDAFHQCSADYVGLGCLRNHDNVYTKFAVPDLNLLTDEQRSILFEPKFTINPDLSHDVENNFHEQDSVVSEEDVKEVGNTQRPLKGPIFSGHPSSPYMKLDPYFMPPLDNDPEAQAAFDALLEAIESNSASVALKAGDFCFIDNRKVVHGREAFKARYDGSDRWLKRLNVTRDLRKSRAFRSTSNSRIVM